jgi:3-oxoacyl-[acyl-carrier-protein] synthase-3
MDRLGVKSDNYVDMVSSHGNMVSASVPYALIHSIESGAVHEGSRILLCGTAAGLSFNALALQM